MKSKFLFIYGTLLRTIRGNMFFNFEKHLRYISPVTYQGKMYEINNYPGVVPSIGSHDLVKGELYEILDPSYLEEVLDEYEGLVKPSGNEGEYIRRVETVTLDDNKILNSWIYLYNRPVSNRTPIPDGDYVRFINDAHYNSQMRSDRT